jgi:hypothetical protein
METKKERRQRLRRERKQKAQEKILEEDTEKIIGLYIARKDKNGELIRPSWHRWVYGAGRKGHDGKEA